MMVPGPSAVRAANHHPAGYGGNAAGSHYVETMQTRWR